MLFRVAPTGARTADLLCRQLYLRTVDAQCGASIQEAAAHEPWMGEPAAVFARPETSPLREIEDHLKHIDVLRVVEGEWLASTTLGAQIEPLLAAFRARGGRVELDVERS